jgi:hypothetical protein
MAEIARQLRDAFVSAVSTFDVEVGGTITQKPNGRWEMVIDIESTDGISIDYPEDYAIRIFDKNPNAIVFHTHPFGSCPLNEEGGCRYSAPSGLDLTVLCSMCRDTGITNMTHIAVDRDGIWTYSPRPGFFDMIAINDEFMENLIWVGNLQCVRLAATSMPVMREWYPDLPDEKRSLHTVQSFIAYYRDMVPTIDGGRTGFDVKFHPYPAAPVRRIATKRARSPTKKAVKKAVRKQTKKKSTANARR